MADNRFGERIILLNKEKVRPSANTKSDEFFWKKIAFNVMWLWHVKRWYHEPQVQLLMVIVIFLFPNYQMYLS